MDAEVNKDLKSSSRRSVKNFTRTMAKSCSVCGMFGGLLRPSWSLSVALSLLLVSLCAGQFIPDTDTLRWITNTYQSTMDEMVKKEGVYIRTRWNDGCLDSGCCSIGFRQVSFFIICVSVHYLCSMYDR